MTSRHFWIKWTQLLPEDKQEEFTEDLRELENEIRERTERLTMQFPRGEGG